MTTVEAVRRSIFNSFSSHTSENISFTFTSRNHSHNVEVRGGCFASFHKVSFNKVEQFRLFKLDACSSSLKSGRRAGL